MAHVLLKTRLYVLKLCEIVFYLKLAEEESWFVSSEQKMRFPDKIIITSNRSFISGCIDENV